MAPILDDENSRDLLNERIGEASAKLNLHNIPLEYSPIVRELAVNAALEGHWDKVDELVFPYNEEELYEHIKATPELGIKLYAPEVGDKIKIEPRPPRIFEEDTFSLIVNQLPYLYERIQASAKPVTFSRFGYAERGIVCRVTIDGVNMVVKTAQNGREEIELAKKLGETGLTPKIYESGNEIFAEEYITYISLREFLHKPQIVGNILGKALYTLRLHNVVYGDSFILSGHLRASPDLLDFKFIDLGTSEISDDYERDWERAEADLLEGCYPNHPHLQKLSVEALLKWKHLAANVQKKTNNQ